MSKDGYSIDDILLEAQKLKEQAEQGDYPKNTEEIEIKQEMIANALDLALDIEQEEKELSAELNSFQMPYTAAQEDLEINEEFFAGTAAAQESPQEVETFSMEIESFILEEPQGPPAVTPPPPSKPKSQPQPKKTKKKPAPKEKVDLFDFQPEKREKPITTGSFGQKRFNFNKSQKIEDDVAPLEAPTGLDEIASHVDAIRDTTVQEHKPVHSK